MLIMGLLVFVLIAIITGTGWYVWHSKQVADKTLDAASKSAQSTASSSTSKKTAAQSPTTTPVSTQSYVTIKEWGVRAAFAGPLHLEYTFRAGNSNTADFTSQELLKADPTCTYEFGGIIARYKAEDQADQLQSGPYQMTVRQYIASDTNKDYAHIGDYYYFFDHTQAGCGSDPNKTSDLISKTNDAVKSLIPKLEAVPAQ